MSDSNWTYNQLGSVLHFCSYSNVCIFHHTHHAGKQRIVLKDEQRHWTVGLTHMEVARAWKPGVGWSYFKQSGSAVVDIGPFSGSLYMAACRAVGCRWAVPVSFSALTFNQLLCLHHNCLAKLNFTLNSFNFLSMSEDTFVVASLAEH